MVSSMNEADSDLILLEVKDESAQTIADTVYQKLAYLQNFHLHDDFTIVIFKKEIK